MFIMTDKNVAFFFYLDLFETHNDIIYGYVIFRMLMTRRLDTSSKVIHVEMQI